MKTELYTLITGASSGIGKELAEIAARDGHNVVLVARNKGLLTQVARDLTKRYDIYAEVIAEDLSRADAPQKIYDKLHKKHISVEILINNAGFGDYGAFVTSELQTQLSMIDLNIRALTELTHQFLPKMVERKSGRIMNVSSLAGFMPGPLMSVYFASKAYVLSFSEALSEELRGSGVSITCLAPGSTKSNFGENANVSETHSTRTSDITAKQVAEFGWNALQTGTPVAVHGFYNRSALWSMRFLPRNMVRRLVHRIQK